MKVNLGYIFWRKECGIKTITKEELEAKVEELETKKYKRVPPSCKVIDYVPKSYSSKIDGKYCRLAIVHQDFTKELYSTNFKDNTKNLQHGAGITAFNSVNDKFKDRTGMTITTAFGSVDAEFKTCIPKQFYYIDESSKNKLISSASSIDFCSQYPSMLCGLLPEAHCRTMKRLKGTIPPNKDYPFAFYLKSGHVAQYNEFDTHTWTKGLLRAYLLGHKQSYDSNPYLDPKDDITVLMKASKYSLTDEMQHFYAKRKTDYNAKLVMNAFIGMLHTESYQCHKQAHIAAIVIARANDRMNNMAAVIGYENILHICVDGCIYRGSTRYGTDIKALNECNQEFLNCQFKMNGMNSYVAIKNGKVEKFKHGAYDARFDGKDIENCSSFEDMEQWYKKSESDIYG